MNLDELEKLLAGATPGEWYVAGDNREEIRIGSPEANSTCAAGPDTVVGSSEWTYCTDADAAAIVALHNAAPGLIADNRRLAERVARLEEALKSCPPTSNPAVSAEHHIERIDAWWRLTARKALEASHD